MRKLTYTLTLEELNNELARLAFPAAFDADDDLDCVVLTEEGHFSATNEEMMEIAREDGWGDDYIVVARKSSRIGGINLERAKDWCNWLMCAFASTHTYRDEYDSAVALFDFGEKAMELSNIQILRKATNNI